MPHFINRAGLKPHIDDGTEFRLGSLINWPKLEELPARYDIDPISIKDQNADGNEDYCASAAGTGMIEPKEEEELYYPFVFAAAKAVSGEDPDEWGLVLKDVGKALQKYGVPSVRDVPDAVKTLPASKRRRFENYPDAVKTAALKHKAKAYFFIPDGPYDAYDNARAAIWYFRGLKRQVLFGVQFGWPLETVLLDGFPKGFGHAMWQSGWSEDGLICVNSAGKAAGQNGKHHMTRDTFNRYAHDFGTLMITDLDREEAEHLLEHGIKLSDNWVIGILKAFINTWLPFLTPLWK